MPVKIVIIAIRTVSLDVKILLRPSHIRGLGESAFESGQKHLHLVNIYVVILILYGFKFHMSLFRMLLQSLFRSSLLVLLTAQNLQYLLLMDQLSSHDSKH